MTMVLKGVCSNSRLYERHSLPESKKDKVQICSSRTSVFESKHTHTYTVKQGSSCTLKQLFNNISDLITIYSKCIQFLQDVFSNIFFFPEIKNIDNFLYFRGEKDDFIVWRHGKR